jgi:hypothetical protein
MTGKEAWSLHHSLYARQHPGLSGQRTTCTGGTGATSLPTIATLHASPNRSKGNGTAGSAQAVEVSRKAAVMRPGQLVTTAARPQASRDTPRSLLTTIG